jgi:hypothetical protein
MSGKAIGGARTGKTRDGVPGGFAVSDRTEPAQADGVRRFFTGQVIKTELLVSWLEQHGIAAREEWVDPTLPDDGDLSREAHVLVPEADFDRAYQLFFTEREGEL